MFSPAHATKHLPLLTYPLKAATNLHLIQSDNSKISNGTTLWLGAQCLSLYLPTIRRPRPNSVLIELGSGIGLTALVMGSQGWDVLATDIPPVISTVLAPNIQNNLPHLPVTSGRIQVRELDWTIPPQHWAWDNNTSITSAELPPENNKVLHLLQPPFDLICTADTIYTPELVQPLLRTFHALCTLSLSVSPAAPPPPVYLCIERRDPALVDRVLAEAHQIWNFSVKRIPRRKLVKVMVKNGLNWSKEDWDSIEIWKFTLPR